METTDLMIGNVVRKQLKDNCNPATIRTLSKDNIVISTSDCNAIAISPMFIGGYPIDDSVLEIIGFLRNDNVFTYDTYDIVKEDDEYTFIGSKIQYIHEIQNIMKVVFNEELPININEL